MGSFQRLPEATVWGLLGWTAEIGRMYLVVTALGFDISLDIVVFLTLANRKRRSAYSTIVTCITVLRFILGCNFF